MAGGVVKSFAQWLGATLIALGILAALAIIAALLAMRSCEVDLDGDVVVLGTAFDDATGTTLLVWPADGEGGRFRWAVLDARGRLHGGDAAVLAWNDGWTLPQPLDPRPARVLLILPRDAGAPLRERAATLLARCEADLPRAGLHRVFGSPEWLDAADGAAAIGLLREMADASRKEQQRHEGLAVGLGRAFSALLVPKLLVVVGEDPERPFHLRGEIPLVLGRPPTEPGGSAEALTALQLEARVRELIAAPAEDQDAAPLSLGFQVLLLLPADLGPDATGRAVRMVESLAAIPGVTAALRRVEDTLEELRVLPER